MFLQPRGFKLSHSSSLMKGECDGGFAMFFFCFLLDSNIVRQLTDLTFSHCMFLVKK